MLPFRQILLISSFFALIVVVKGQTLNPSSSEAKVVLFLKDAKMKPLETQINFFGKKSKKHFKGNAGKDGKLEVLLPIGQTYFVYLPASPEYFELEVPAIPNNIIQNNFVIRDFEPGKLHATPTEALLNFKIENTDKTPLAEDILLIGKKSKQEFKTKSNINGITNILVPINDTYILNFTNAPSFEEIAIPNEPFYLLKETIYFMGHSQTLHPSTTQALFCVSYIDLWGNLSKDEQIIITNLTTNKTYESRTGQNGVAYISVPFGNNYSISAKYLPGFCTHSVQNKSMQYINISITYISSADYEFRKKERLLAITIRDSLFKLNKNTDDLSKDRIEVEANEIRKLLLTEPKFFERRRSPVASVLYRMRNKWKNKMIVVDCTTSMDNYTKEILLWVALKATDGEKNNFIFFNDGDSKYPGQKWIGKTGGFHYTSSANIDTLISTMDVSRSKGLYNNEIEENDIEALLEGSKKKKNIDELILVKDNYSPVRDMVLLKQLNVPVRVIACGVIDEINEDALEIAYKTKGSVHTIEEDIMDLSSHKDGDSVKIGKKTYRICKGKFVLIE